MTSLLLLDLSQTSFAILFTADLSQVSVGAGDNANGEYAQNVVYTERTMHVLKMAMSLLGIRYYKVHKKKCCAVTMYH